MGLKLPYPKGVYRFKTFEEADEWETRHRIEAAVKRSRGVPVPFASPQTLWRTKETVREKDIPDRLFLRQWHEARGLALDPPLLLTQGDDDALIRAWRRIKGWWRKQ